MASRIAVVTRGMADDEVVRRMAPQGFELVITDPGRPDWMETMAKADYLVGFVDMLVKDSLYETAPKLRLVQVLSAGYDKADLDAARRAGVPLANNGGANSTAVAEHALLLMLATSRQLVKQHRNVAAGRWRGNATPRLHELRDRVLGIVGLGTIGKKVARLALAFGMVVHYYDIARLPEDAEDALGVRFRLYRELLRSSDIVSLHVPLNASTKGMLGAEEIALMKPGAVLVNTSRGPVVDEPALYRAMTEGRLYGAGLDVFEEEPPPADNPLLALDNVILTAHMAGPTQESNIARLRNAFDNVQRVERGEPPLWVVPELSG